MTHATSLDREPDEAAYPEPPGGGIGVAIAGGLAGAGAMFLVFMPPLVIVWLATAAVLTGIAVSRPIHAVTATIAAAAPAILTLSLVTCRTGAWDWLLAGIVVFLGIVLIGMPLGFLIGRLLRSRVARWFPVTRIVLLTAAVLAAVGWAALIASAVLPGGCPPAV